MTSHHAPRARHSVTISTLAVVVWLMVDVSSVRSYVGPPNAVFIDAEIYLRAAEAWLAGGDPWSASYMGYYFAAPPPTLLFYAPLTLIPRDIATVVLVVGGIVAVVATIRVLHLPVYWILFPPFVDAVLAASSDAFLVPILLGLPWFGRWIAPALKLFAVVPIVGLRDWRALGLLCVALPISLPVLPWATFMGQFGEITEILDAQAIIQLSAWGNAPLMVVAAVALLAIGRERAGWLAVPAIWPHAQLHYAAMSSPAARPLLIAITFALPLAYFPVVGVVLLAVVDRLKDRWVSLRLLLEPV